MHGLIVLSVDDIERLETFVEYYGLIDLLRDYSTEFPDRMGSIYDVGSPKYVFYANRSLAGRGLKAMRVAEELMKGVRESHR